VARACVEVAMLSTVCMAVAVLDYPLNFYLHHTVMTRLNDAAQLHMTHTVRSIRLGTGHQPGRRLRLER
jgi:hypothetical protein